MKHPWLNLSPTRFEQFCFHLLRFCGFQDVEWLGAAGSDKGRDIICRKSERVFRQRSVSRRWIVQCKQYRSKRPTKAEVLEWLAACREHKPDRVLLIVSKSLTASFRDWLVSLRHEHPFEIHVWDENELCEEFSHHRRRLVTLFPTLPKVSRAVEFYAVAPCDRTIYCNEFEEVGFVVMNSDSDEEAEDRVLEFVEFIKANDIRIWKRPKKRK